MAELISIIVPVYNTGAYLRRCVQSVLRQTYPHMELLLIDDGSQDGSAAICEELCRGDMRVRFLPRAHAGVSAARNIGIDESRGSYLFFLDSDDIIHPRLLEALLHLCEATGAPLATEVYRYVYTAEPVTYKDEPNGGADREWSHSYMDNQEALRQFSSSDNSDKFHGIGGKLIRRGAIGPLRFDESMHNGEDTLFIFQLLETGLDAVILWEPWYAYQKHAEGSSQRLTTQSCKDSYRCWIYIWDRIQDRPDEAAFWAYSILSQLRWLYVRSRQNRDGETSAYLRALGKREVHSGRFRLLPRSERVKHCLAFWCCTLYMSIHRVTNWWWKQKQKRRHREQDGNS